MSARVVEHEGVGLSRRGLAIFPFRKAKRRSEIHFAVRLGRAYCVSKETQGRSPEIAFSMRLTLPSSVASIQISIAIHWRCLDFGINWG
mgnify:CR=1 FL=1